MTQIVVRRRSDDYHAHLAGSLGHWGCGPTQAAAIGDLILSYPEECGVDPAVREVAGKRSFLSPRTGEARS